MATPGRRVVVDAGEALLFSNQGIVRAVPPEAWVGLRRAVTVNAPEPSLARAIEYEDAVCDMSYKIPLLHQS